MSQLAGLKAASTFNEVARVLGYEPSDLAYILYKLPPPKYITFAIPKRTGGVRQISSPVNHLKRVQERLSDLLQDCLEEIEATGSKRSASSHGFRRGRSIFSNARNHRRRRYVFNVDLENFFGAINFGRVRGFFLHDTQFVLHEKAATVIAQIACYNHGLPQGSPCSPIISDLIGQILDTHLARLAAHLGCRYTRYADDLTFSTSEPNFPKSIAVCVDQTRNTWIPGRALVSRVEHCGFAINAAKTRMQYRDSRQEVTGLVVNRKVNVRHDYRSRVRVMVHRLLTVGDFYFPRTEVDLLGEKTQIQVPGRSKQLHGMLGFIDQIDISNKELLEKSVGQYAKKLTKVQQKRRLTSKERIYQRFLLFNEFFATTRPVLICEGATDNVYMVHAIRSLAAAFPSLAAPDANGKIAINIRIYKYSKTSTERILDIHGGSGDLFNLIKLYAFEARKFTAPGGIYPVIVLLDNDKGAGDIFNYIRKVKKQDVTGKEPYLHVARNMYVVPTPLNGQAKSVIEDFFTADLKKELIDGKPFNPQKDHGDDTCYGKVVFAHKVVRPKAESIDFSGFAPLLSNITAAIAAHAAILASAPIGASPLSGP